MKISFNQMAFFTVGTLYKFRITDLNSDYKSSGFKTFTEVPLSASAIGFSTESTDAPLPYAIDLNYNFDII